MERFIGKGKYDKKFHLIEEHNGVPKRICTWLPVECEVVLGDKITCENCQIRQWDNDWSNSSKILFFFFLKRY